MNGAFYIGATGLSAEQRALDIVAHNISNMNTPSFKRSSVRFTELVSPAADQKNLAIIGDQPQPAPAGVSIGSVQRVWTPGDVRQTGNAFDLAIKGAGFIELLGSSGRALLWRGGTLKVNQDGYLATTDGTALRALITAPQSASNFTISPDGIVTALVDGDDAPTQIGQIELVMAKDPDSLSEVGNGYFESTDPAGVYTAGPGEDGAGTLAQGAIEQANVQLSDEMVMLMMVQRAYAANAQLVQAGDQLMSIANNLRR